MNEPILNPAEVAAETALQRVLGCVKESKSFRLEAGAGAGKTHSLIRALKFIISGQGAILLRRHQKVACITYTNVAKDEIESRTDRHPAIYCDTIHGFCWSVIKDFQAQIKDALPLLEGWAEKLQEHGGVGERIVEYSLGHRTVNDECISIRHADVLALFMIMMKREKFRAILASRYPIIFIDEYQDTDTDFAEALKIYFLGQEGSPLIGFFGDHWQMIYRGVCGRIEHPALDSIKKEANFRSVKVVVDVLNRMRPELIQNVVDPTAEGSVAVYHTNGWTGERRTGQHWKGDLPETVAHDFLKALTKQLGAEGWGFSSSETKILMLTHNVLAAEQGYRDLANVFRYNEAFIKKENDHIGFFVDKLEPISLAYKEKRYGEMFLAIGGKTPSIRSHGDKVEWTKAMDALLKVRDSGTIGDVVDYLRQTHRLSLPEAVERQERALERLGPNPSFEEDSPLETLYKLRQVPYKQVVALDRFLDDLTPFSTKHGVKGAEFENVLVVLGRGWNLYDFNQMLEWAPDRAPLEKQDTFERNRNLFYVACSRPKRRLALLFTQRLSEKALATLTVWFGSEAIHSFSAS